MGNKGVDTWDARRRFYNRTEWDHGGGHVGLWSTLNTIFNVTNTNRLAQQ